MSWLDLGRDLGVFGIVAFVIQKIIENSSNRSLERYKQELDFTIRSHQLNLDTDLERYKSELSLHASRQTTLHDKRLTIIDEMYRKIVLLDSTMRSMTGIHIVVEDGERERQERITKAQEAFSDYNNYFLFNKLYFNHQTSDLLENVRKEYYSANWDFFELNRLQSFTGGQSSVQARREAYDKVEAASNRIRVDIPKILETLEEEFRNLLGVN